MAILKAFVEQMISAAIAVAICISAIFLFVAEPLDFRALLADADVYHPGDEMVIQSRSYKPKWSARLCTTEQGATYVRDADGQEFAFASAVDFNDGSKPGLTTRMTIPREVAEGSACIFRRVVYRCMGVFRITVSSSNAPLCVAIVAPT